MRRRPKLPLSMPLLLAAALLAGCGSLLESDSPPDTRWWLEPTTVAGDAAREPIALVLDFRVVPGLDTDRVLNLDDNARLNHYAGAHWPDHLPEFIGSVLARSLEGGGWRQVREGDYARPGECLLTLELRRFYGRLGGDGVTDRVELSMAGAMTCDGSTRSVSVASENAVSANRMSVIVDAFQVALDQATRKLAQQL